MESSLKVLLIAGARPNFMKVAPIYAEMKRRPQEFEPMIVHTGQHYDAAMSDAFFDDLGMPKPDIHLGVGSASHAVQTAKIMTEFEPVVLERKTRLGVGRRRCEFDDRVCIGLCKTWRKGRSCRSGPSFARPIDARRDQPYSH